MTLEEIKQTDWYKERPEIVQKAICEKPPGLYRMKDGHQCIIYSYMEPTDENVSVWLSVIKTGVHEELGILAKFDEGTLVFGVAMDDITPWEVNEVTKWN